jgi:protein-S-isoprenylcysteine O-methyltransferase Ste14
MTTTPPIDESQTELGRILLRCAMFAAIFAGLLFIPAGTVAWPGAWVFLAMVAAVSVAGMIALARYDPELLRERMRSPLQRGQPAWDRALMLVFMPLWFGWYVLMGFDHRFGWSSVPAALQVLGAILLALGIYLSWLTMMANSYAAPVVKVQRERGHRVASGGPYAYVRHPMYASVILFAAGVPLLLGSWWGLAVAPILILALAVRAVLEERMLKAELSGYEEYAAKVRYRFVPYLW